LILRQKVRWGRLDSLLLISLAGGFAWLGYQVDAGLDYHWNWQTIPQYLVRYDPGEARWVPNLLLEGLLTTIRLSCWSLVLAMPLGLAIGLLRTSLHLFNKLLGGSYVALLRNLPPLVLVLIFYFFISDQLLPLLHIPDLLNGLPPAMREAVALGIAPPDQLEAFIAAILTLALFESAYVAEIVRAGINSIDSGQWQVARALGMRRWQLMRHVILPQALQRMIPPLTGQAISTIKDSAIVSVISIQELTFQGMELMAATYLTFEVWLTVTLLYFILTYSCSCLAGQLEKKLRRAY
jgi:polar amino acid transport system permease protein